MIRLYWSSLRPAARLALVAVVSAAGFGTWGVGDWYHHRNDWTKEHPTW